MVQPVLKAFKVYVVSRGLEDFKDLEGSKDSKAILVFKVIKAI